MNAPSLCLCRPFFPISLLVLAVLPWPGIQAQDKLAEKNKEVAEGFDIAQTALKQFLEAETWEAAAEFVLDKDTLADQMKAHYGAHPWKPVELEAIRYSGGVEVKGEVTYFTHDFQLVAKGKPQVIPATMVQDGEKYLLDWEIFAQIHDGTFEEFLKGEDQSVRSFRVTMHRGVVLGEHEALGLAGGTIRLRAAWHPGIFFPGELFASASSDVGKEIEAKVPWQNGAAFRVKLKWSKSKDEKRSFIEVVELGSLNFATPSLFD